MLTTTKAGTAIRVKKYANLPTIDIDILNPVVLECRAANAWKDFRDEDRIGSVFSCLFMNGTQQDIDIVKEFVPGMKSISIVNMNSSNIPQRERITWAPPYTGIQSMPLKAGTACVVKPMTDDSRLQGTYKLNCLGQQSA